MGERKAHRAVLYHGFVPAASRKQGVPTCVRVRLGGTRHLTNSEISHLADAQGA